MHFFGCETYFCDLPFSDLNAETKKSITTEKNEYIGSGYNTAKSRKEWALQYESVQKFLKHDQPLLIYLCYRLRHK